MECCCCQHDLVTICGEPGDVYAIDFHDLHKTRVTLAICNLKERSPSSLWVTNIGRFGRSFTFVGARYRQSSTQSPARVGVKRRLRTEQCHFFAPKVISSTTQVNTGPLIQLFRLPETPSVTELVLIKEIPPRDHAAYKNATPCSDGLFHCPWEGQAECKHEPHRQERAYR